MPVDPRVYIAIVDMRIIWQMSTPTGEDQENLMLKSTLGGILPPKLSVSLFLYIR